MSRDREYAEYGKKAGIENRNIDPGSLAYITEQQQKAYYQKLAKSLNNYICDFRFD